MVLGVSFCVVDGPGAVGMVVLGWGLGCWSVLGSPLGWLGCRWEDSVFVEEDVLLLSIVVLGRVRVCGGRAWYRLRTFSSFGAI